MNVRHALSRLAALGALSSVALAGCDGPSSTDDAGSSARDDAAMSATGDASRSDAGALMGGDPTSGCEGRLEPAAPSGHVATVGDGSAASCTEDALHAAVAEVDAAGGGTVRFDCGGALTITLSRSVHVGGPATILDGGGEITLSGGGAVRVIELDHHVDFVLQRITIRLQGPEGIGIDCGMGLALDFIEQECGFVRREFSGYPLFQVLAGNVSPLGGDMIDCAIKGFPIFTTDQQGSLFNRLMHGPASRFKAWDIGVPIHGAMHLRGCTQMLLYLTSRNATPQRRRYWNRINGVVRLDMLTAISFPRLPHSAPFTLRP